MSELERALRGLAPELAWPEAPDVARRLELGQRPRRRLVPLLAAALALAAIAVALAVPDARTSILRFLHLGGVTIERVSTLPQADERPLAAALGPTITPEAAAVVLGRPFLLPDVAGRRPALHARDGVVSALLAAPEPVLLSELGSSGFLKKLAGDATSVEPVAVADGVEGLWLTGSRHVFFGPGLPPRLAGNVLLFERDGVTFRLEGRALTKARALALTREILR